MMQLDKAIREGLVRQAAAPAAVHPDADLLTAFVEQTLSQPERQQILQHLSLCGDCRETLALALPELEAAAVAAAQPGTSIWSRWLVVRWAAAAAAVIVVAGTVTLYRSNNQPHQVASIVDGPAYVASQQAKTASPSAAADAAPLPKTEAKTEAAPTEAKKKAEAKKQDEPVMMASAAPPPVAPAPALAKSAMAADSLNRQQVATTDKDRNLPPAPAANVNALSQPTLSTQAKVVPLERPMQVPGAMTAAAGAANEGFPAGTGRSLRPSEEPPLQVYDQTNAPFTVAEASSNRGPKFGGRGTEAGLVARRDQIGTTSMFSNLPMPSASTLNHRWLVGSDGQLKRSHAIGEEFHSVHVADGVFFKSVAESGTEVWAGGIGGALYHSTDDGRNWMKLMPSAGDQPLIADITAIRATHRGTAELSTSTGETWITVDGGQHWARHQ